MEPKREPKHPSLANFSSSLFIKIDPCRIEFAMIILHPHGFGDVVARGHNLCMQLWSQNCELAASGGENCLAANKKMPSKMTKLGTPMMLASKCNS